MTAANIMKIAFLSVAITTSSETNYFFLSGWLQHWRHACGDCFQPPSIFTSSLNLHKQVLADPANWANPFVGEFLEGGSRFDTISNISFCRVIDIVTDGASPFLHGTFSFYDYSRQWIQETGQISMASCWIVFSEAPVGS